MRRIITTLIVLGLLTGVGYLGYQRFSRSQQPERVAGEQIPVTPGTISATVNATGSVAPARQVTLTFRTPGRVQAIAVAEGARVAAGDLLAQQETTDLEFAVAQAEASLAVAEARLRQLQQPGRESDIVAAEAQLASARENLARAQEGANAEDVRAARAQLSAAQAALNKVLAGPDETQLRQAQANLARAEAALQQAQAAYDQVKWRNDIGALPQSLQLQQATIDYEAAKASYDAAAAGPGQEQIEQARAQVVQAEASLDRLTRGPTAADIAAAEAQVAQAEASLVKLREGADPNEIAAAEAQVAQAEIALEQAQANLEGAAIVAPFAGTVASVGAQETELVTSATPMIVLVDLSAFHLDVQVDEIDVGQVKVGDTVTVTLDAFREQPFPGVIERVSPVATTVQGVVSYPVRIALDQAAAPGELRSGLTANAAITTERREGVLLVPNRAISIDRASGELFVEKLAAGGTSTTRTRITTGLRNESVSEVTSGLSAGEIIVIPTVDPADELRPRFGG